ncbi:MAG: 3-phosphoserine/phosphohydroxythreonine transaminase [Phycisphaeraceae bacterium]|nr:3-phosphoserine/phosphohydroxythreonine transaminase [Phycisphaerales bacterium]MCB9860143.1 3-phosphoserine/phosphohydroxythreonine transaminase [Phycisphaeraceae bacterium]
MANATLNPTNPVVKALNRENSDRIWNLSAGPGCLPEDVLKQIQGDIWNVMGSGVGILEHSHRGKVIDEIFARTHDLVREVLSVPSGYTVMFGTGGASTQAHMIPMNFMPKGGVADYFVTGLWAQKAYKQAKYIGKPHVCATSEDKKHSYIPSPSETNYSENPAYVHFTSNNTVAGTQFAKNAEPTAPAGVPLICDMSSDIASRTCDISKYDMIYAGAQKNLGPAGTTLVIIRDEFMAKENNELPDLLRYSATADQLSRWNTPPVFPIYVVGLVLQWYKDQGGVAAMEKRNNAKAKVIYDVLDAGFYLPHARKDSRSMMNITFNLPSPEIEKRFFEEATAHGFSAIEGHRSVGGVRASIYNSFPAEGCDAFAQFLREFAKRNG